MIKANLGLLGVSIGSCIFWECLTKPMPQKIALGIIGSLLIIGGVIILRDVLFTTKAKSDN
jgi:hypothetical protein